jgi:ketosteroid isomerase-like protein
VPSANVKLVQSIFAAWEAGDYSRPGEWAHPEIEFVFVEGPSPGKYTGLTGLADAWRDFLSAWEEWRSVAEDYRELDDEHVLVLVRYGGRGKASRLDVGQMRTEAAGLFQIHGGMVRRLVFYWDRARALSDLGLPSEAGASSS